MINIETRVINFVVYNIAVNYGTSEQEFCEETEDKTWPIERKRMTPGRDMDGRRWSKCTVSIIAYLYKISRSFPFIQIILFCDLKIIIEKKLNWHFVKKLIFWIFE